MEVIQKHNDRQDTVPFDSLAKVRDMEDTGGSIWTGKRGTYIIRHIERPAVRRPVARVMLNSQYLTGLFRTRQKTVYSADIKAGEGKVYLLFHIVGEGKIDIEQVLQKIKN